MPIPEKSLPKEYPSDAPVVQDGGRIKLLADVRARAGWPTGGSYPIIVELIEQGWVELHTRDQKEARVARARRWAESSGKPPVSTDNLQGVDDVFQHAIFDPNDGRFQIPPSVLPYLNVRPKDSDVEEEPANGGSKRGGKKKRKPLARYGGQQVYVQAGEAWITVMSLERRNQRTDQVLKDLQTDGSA